MKAQAVSVEGHPVAASKGGSVSVEVASPNAARPEQLPPRMAAEKAIARFRAVDSSGKETEEAFIHLMVGRGFAATDRQP